ncbi:transcriptional regulator [Burkholderia sp. SRS-W-2-2016]|uniref:transcriptional regulator n=1 Tax=Burkholderia sp. SRS-W-2-2016 TaxID=1926878 RepID=UPI00094B50AC|nr:transcriptional regulator [Burkholderia sp. SRS-W-2-2016]OLL31832.1 transcriptional regulator [Burkholderia sp. SRS-W-2-2016]
MEHPEHVLISLEERHAENILTGTKHVELRRRAMHVKKGTVVWIYVKLPVGRVVGYAKVSEAHSLAPATLWRRFANVCGITRKEFFQYFDGVSKGFALGLHEPQRLAGSISLTELRQVSEGFQPPQFFTRIAPGSPLLQAIERKCA